MERQAAGQVVSQDWDCRVEVLADRWDLDHQEWDRQAPGGPEERASVDQGPAGRELSPRNARGRTNDGGRMSTYRAHP
jgi:hypothetical protein